MFNKKKNILIITSQFIPYTRSIGGVARLFSFSQELKKKYNVTILSIKDNYYGFFGLKNKIDNAEIIFLNKYKTDNSKFLILKKIIKILFRNLFYILAIDACTPLKSSLMKASKSIIKKNKIDIVIISGPPFSLFSLVKNIKVEYPKVKIILDYRDGWTTRVSSIYLSIFSKFVFNFFEKRYLKFASLITTATSTIKEDLDKQIKLNSYLVTNGYMSKINLKKKIDNSTDKIKIGYFGLISESLFSYRNIDILYQSLLDNSNINIHFYGNSEIKKKKYKNFNNFYFHKNIDATKVSNEMKKMDYLLIFHSEKSTVREVITGKFYEYLTVGVPILSITNGLSEVSKIINNHNFGTSIDYSKEDLKFFFRYKLKKNYTINHNTKLLRQFSRNTQNKLFLNKVDSIC